MASSNTAWFNEKLGEIISCRVKLVWPNLLTPSRIKGKPESRLRFTATGLIPAGSNTAALDKAFDEAARGLHGVKWKTNKKLLLALDSTAEHDNASIAEMAEEFPFYLKASANEDSKPRLYVVKAGKLETFEGEASDIYSGRWAFFGGGFYPYDKGSKGVNFGLNRVILADHDERLPVSGGGPAADSTEGFENFELGEGESASDMFR